MSEEIEETIEERDLNATLAYLHVALRELNFHLAAAMGAEQGLQDCLDQLGDPEISKDEDVAFWARRVSSTYEAASEVAHVVSVEANILARIMEPTKGETEN